MIRVDIPIFQSQVPADWLLANRALDTARVNQFEAQVLAAENPAAPDAAATPPSLVTRAGTFTYDPSIFSEAMVGAEVTTNRNAGYHTMRYLGRWTTRNPEFSEDFTPAELSVTKHRGLLARMLGATTIEVIRGNLQD